MSKTTAYRLNNGQPESNILKVVLKNYKTLCFENLEVGDFFMIEGEILRKVNHGTVQNPQSLQDEPFTAMHMPTGMLVFVGSSMKVERVRASLHIENA